MVKNHLQAALGSLAALGISLSPEGLLAKLQDASSAIEEELAVIAATMAYFKARMFLGAAAALYDSILVSTNERIFLHCHYMIYPSIFDGSKR